MHKRKIAAGAALIAMAAMPFSLAIASIANSGGLPADPQEYNPSPRMKLGLSLSFFVYPMSFFGLGIGSWLVAFGMTGRSIVSGKREQKESQPLPAASFLMRIIIPRSVKKQKKVLGGFAALAMAGALLALSLIFYYLPATRWGQELQSCTDCPDTRTDALRSEMQSLLTTGNTLSISGGMLAVLGIVLLAQSFRSKTSPNVLEQ